MMKDITWGQYHSVDSMIHRIDPRVKIRFTIIYIILLLLDRNLPLFLFLQYLPVCGRAAGCRCAR